MGKVFEQIDGAIEEFIRAQQMFFVATGPLSGTGHINVSPKGLNSLRILGPHALAYLDYVGSGAETIAHLRENGRICVMFCAFDGPPRIVRFHGRGEAILLGEVNLPYSDLMPFFGGADGGNTPDELTMCFDFIDMQMMYLSLARADAEPLADALRQRPDPPEDGHWATFVRNHDELTLDKLTDAQRKEVFAAFGPDKDMQVYDRGLRRRLPGMLSGDLARIEDGLQPAFALPALR